MKKRETGTKDWKKKRPRIYELGANGKDWGLEFTNWGRILERLESRIHERLEPRIHELGANSRKIGIAYSRRIGGEITKDWSREFTNWGRMGKIGIANSRRIGAANSLIGCEFGKDWSREFTNWGRMGKIGIANSRRIGAANSRIGGEFYEGLGLRIHELWAANSRKV